MNDNIIQLLVYFKKFNSELLELNIKYSEEIERLNKEIKDLRSKINE